MCLSLGIKKDFADIIDVRRKKLLLFLKLAAVWINAISGMREFFFERELLFCPRKFFAPPAPPPQLGCKSWGSSGPGLEGGKNELKL